MLSSQSHTDDPLVQLQRIWRHERFTSHLLPYASHFLQKLNTVLIKQASFIDTVTPSFRAEASVVHVVYESEMERFKWFMAQYERVRLNKIEKYAAWLLNQWEQGVETNMTAEEVEFAQEFVALEQNYTNQTVLSNLPSNLQEYLPEEIMKPDPLEPAICQLNNNQEMVELLDAFGGRVELHPDQILLVQTGAILDLLEQNKILLV